MDMCCTAELLFLKEIKWWKPAVENQATDRTYRIGQKKNVIVHKLVCKGTIEEKINEMIESKKELAANELAEVLGVKETRTKELLRALVSDKKLEDNGATKGKRYKKR